MQTHTRHVVAYVAGSLISGQRSSAVFDRQERRRFNISGTLSDSNISACASGQDCHITGSLASLYHCGNLGRLTLKLNSAQFFGYDSESRQHFSGNVNGNSVSIYDNETRRRYSYSI